MPELLESETPAEVHFRPDPVAPWPHTVFILVVLALWATYGALYSPASMVSRVPRSVMYTGQMMVQYLLAGSTIAGLYHRRRFLAAVFGDFRLRHVFRDIGSGFLVYLGGIAVVLVLGILLQPSRLVHNRAAVSAVAPHSAIELSLWILVSLTAGLCEEFLFRGYLLQQFRRWSGSVPLAIGASALVFGSLHIYEGTATAIQITGLGAFYAIIAVRRGNLRHVMIAHFFQDAITGALIYLRH
jgi:membrane protease YdiL (CAAX protease family)